uniref:WRKY transcription factor 44 n=1 Tax=Santalum album TaxID=35974 RepID=A0A650C347_SANAL|nr:WRKY transcription factor 44 [Santalum album]
MVMVEVNANCETRNSEVRSHEENFTAPETPSQCSDGEKVAIRDTAAGASKGNDSSIASSCSRFLSGATSSVSRYKLMSPAKLPISRLPCPTTPPGLSPSSLLDSPVLLWNVEVEPSPTTGTLPMLLLMKGQVGTGAFSYPMHSSSASTSDERNSSDFFRRHHRSSLGYGFVSSGPPVPTVTDFHKCEWSVGSQDQGDPPSFASCSIRNERVAPSSLDLDLSVTTPKTTAQMFTTDLCAGLDHGKSQQSRDSDILVKASQSEHRENDALITGEKSAEDCYNWRKYGQKHVKGSEFPRGYYKCTYSNCQVKKQVERSYDGKITEIIFKGQHNHPKPQPRRRFPAGSVLSMYGEKLEKFSVTNKEDKTSNAYGQTSYHTEPEGTSELLPVTASDDEHDDDNDDDDPDLKRRRQDLGNADVVPLFKPTREPRVVVQTLSEVDILDDGYRWRKYGQKVVKGNPNPRSYYKCTNAGCPVRKHVERASHDLKAVITTYEGKHNHDVPVTRTASHDTAGPGTYATPMDAVSGSRVEENDAARLDLGVGITSSPQNETNGKEGETDRVQMDIASSNLSKVIPATPVSACFEVLNGDVDTCVTQDSKGGESFSFEAAHLNHSSDPYSQSIGGLVIGP